MRDFVHSRDYNERQVGKGRPDPMSATEWLIVLSFTTGVLGILGGLIYLCLLLIRG